ncbi:helicase associated domain-containing protein [Streptomyces californicus]|uniref:helicase associated domain-containing protein n=1 Tax=Streptomyces californicus TaxID=67351 RepID=UPI0037122B45
MWAIASALASHDHRILERLPDKANRLPKETSDVIERRWHFDFTVHPERIAQAMDLVSFDPRDPTTSRSRRLGLAAAQAYHDQHSHLDVPATTPLGAWLAEQRHLADTGELASARADALNAIDHDWRLPHGADWHRKYHLLRTHLEAGNGPAALTPDTCIAGANTTSWLTRQLARWTTLHPGQRDLLSALNLTPTASPLTPARRTFAQTVQLLELFLHRHGRAPTARETLRVDGDTVQIGPWFAKTRTKHRDGQLPADHQALVAALFDGDWCAPGPVPAAVA